MQKRLIEIAGSPRVLGPIGSGMTMAIILIIRLFMLRRMKMNASYWTAVRMKWKLRRAMGQLRCVQQWQQTPEPMEWIGKAGNFFWLVWALLCNLVVVFLRNPMRMWLIWHRNIVDEGCLNDGLFFIALNDVCWSLWLFFVCCINRLIEEHN